MIGYRLDGIQIEAEPKKDIRTITFKQKGVRGSTKTGHHEKENLSHGQNLDMNCPGDQNNLTELDEYEP